MQRITINTNGIKTIDWFQNKVVDWNSAGCQYSEDGSVNHLAKYHFGFLCDASITSEDGEFVLIYQKLGTKGLLLKNGEVHREIDRSYYQSAVYEFPAAFLNFNGKTYLIHCPNKYNQLDFEDAQTGEIITDNNRRDPSDFFHSRLEVSPDNKFLISKGWFWHPFDMVQLFNIEQCFEKPELLDQGNSIPNSTTEICSASFIDNETVLVCSSLEEAMDDENHEPIPEGHIATWNIKTNKISKAVKVKGPYGNLFAIDHKYCWDLFKYPKIIDFTSGEIVDRIEEINSGEQGSSIIHHLETIPKVSYNRKTKQIAVVQKNTVEILSK